MDRHKTPRTYQSGSQKRKTLKDKEQKITQIISKSAKISDFFSGASEPIVLSEQQECTQEVEKQLTALPSKFYYI